MARTLAHLYAERLRLRERMRVAKYNGDRELIAKLERVHADVERRISIAARAEARA